MPQIQCVTNVTTYATLPVEGTWSLQGGFPTDVDEILIRQITYTSTDLGRLTYLIRSDISHQIVGTVFNSETFVSCPGTIIRPRGPLQNNINFWVEQFIPTGIVTVGDQISISMDFIKYKKL